ncbi:MAG: CDP-alcohol phosphatidyltransferase family protein [Patescibacteria group bacterium]
MLDGAVARKYNKTSKLGNILDTLSDFMIGFILYNYIQKYSYLRVLLSYQ